MIRVAIGKRRHVVLSDIQDGRLTRLAKSTGITTSEHIRRAIDSYFRALEMASARKPK